MFLTLMVFLSVQDQFRYILGMILTNILQIHCECLPIPYELLTIVIMVQMGLKIIKYQINDATAWRML